MNIIIVKYSLPYVDASTGFIAEKNNNLNYLEVTFTI